MVDLVVGGVSDLRDRNPDEQPNYCAGRADGYPFRPLVQPNPATRSDCPPRGALVERLTTSCSPVSRQKLLAPETIKMIAMRVRTAARSSVVCDSYREFGPFQHGQMCITGGAEERT